MNRAIHKRERAARKARRKRREQERRSQASHQATIPIPDDPAEFYRDHIWWPHKSRMTPVKGSNAIQEDFFKRRTSFRVDDNGNRVTGLDIIVKPRQVYMTSGVLGLLIWAMLKYPGFQAATVLHTAGKDARKLWNRFKYALDHLPKEWGSITGKSAGETIEWSNSSTWTLYTAGAGENIAEKVGVSTSIHGLHLSESGKYSHPEAVWGAVKPALSDESGWCVAECTPPRVRTHWHMQEYYYTRDGHGQFTAAFFWPWTMFDGCRIGKNDIRYSRVMTREFENTRLSVEDMATEDRMELTGQQRAWRRWNFFQGTPHSIRKNRREFPEDDETCFGFEEIDSYLSEDALDIIDINTSDPVYEERITPMLTAKIWVENPGEFIVAASDQASRNGIDCSTTEFIGHESREQFAEIHGHCYASEHVSAIEWMIHRLISGIKVSYHEWAGDRQFDEIKYRSKYIHCHDNTKEFGLSDELHQSRLRNYRHRKKNMKTRQYEYSQAIGMRTDRNTRPEIINLISFWSEGPTDPLEPQCAINSAALAAELRTLVDKGAKVEHAEGENDDLAMAWGMAHYIAGKVKPNSPAGSSVRASPQTRSDAHEINVDRSRSSRRRGGPM